jgi:transcription elongation factor GreB
VRLKKRENPLNEEASPTPKAMSKAFTKEDGPEEPEVTRPRPSGRRLLTPEGHAQLLSEFRRARDEERPRLLGDVSVGGRQALRTLEARLVELTALLEAAEVVPPAPDESPAAFGAWVTTLDEAGERSTVRLVGPDEANPRLGLLSVASPVGRALLGRRPGDTALVERPRGATELRVVDVQQRR